MRMLRSQRETNSAFVDGLILHAARLNRDACEALVAGRHAEAERLLLQAELLASDVTGLVDDLEREQVECERNFFLSPKVGRPSRTRKLLRLGIGASLATGVMLTEI